MPLNYDMKLVTRPLESADEMEWRRLWKAYLEYYETVLPEETYRSTFNRKSLWVSRYEICQIFFGSKKAPPKGHGFLV